MAESKKAEPSSNGANGHGPDGKFTKGNPGGPGNPFAKQAAELRAALYEAVTTKDIEEIAAKLVAKAKRAEVPAIKELFDRLWGKAPQAVELSGADGDAIKVDIGGDLTDEEIERIAEAVSAGRGAVK